MIILEQGIFGRFKIPGIFGPAEIQAKSRGKKELENPFQIKSSKISTTPQRKKRIKNKEKYQTLYKM